MVTVLLGGAALTAAPIRSVESRMDAVTGSISWRTEWAGVFGAGTRVQTSPLETRLRASGIAWSPSWRLLHDTDYNVLGGRISVGCGRAPPIYSLRFNLKEFAAACTDDELREFARVMQTGTEAEQEAAVDAAYMRIDEWLSCRHNPQNTRSGDTFPAWPSQLLSRLAGEVPSESASEAVRIWDS